MKKGIFIEESVTSFKEIKRYDNKLVFHEIFIS